MEIHAVRPAEDVFVDYSRKPSKQRRLCQEHSAVRRATPEVANAHHDKSTPSEKSDDSITRGCGILERVLQAPPTSIRVNYNWNREPIGQLQQQQHIEHALRCFQRLLSHLKQKNHGLSPKLWRDLHGFVVLHLGNIQSNAETGYDDIIMNIMITIGSSLLQIYQFTEQPENIFTKEELQLVFSLILHHASATSTTITKSNEEKSHLSHLQLQSSKKVELVSIWVKILRLLIRAYSPVINSMEHLTVLLVRLLCDGGIDPASAAHSQARCLLEDLSNIDSPTIAYFAKQARAAVEALQQRSSNKGYAMDLSSPPFSVSHHDNLLYWKCLAQSHRGATSLSQSLKVLDHLVDLAISSFGNDEGDRHTIPISFSAVNCLSLVATNRQPVTSIEDATPEDEPDWTMDALLRVLVKTRDPMVRHLTIPGLKACGPNSIPWQDRRFLETVLSSLFDIATAKEAGSSASNYADHKRDAAIILVAILEQTSFLPSSHNNKAPLALLPFAQATKYLGSLLTVEHDPVLQQLAMETLYRETRRSQCRVVLEDPIILRDVGALTCHPFTPTYLQHRAMEIFESVSRTDDNDVAGILARQSKVLEALVVMASVVPCRRQHEDNNNDNDPTSNWSTQELAMVVLLRLARNVCNRRILAQQVGVLACMIRYARRLSDQQHQQQRPTTPDGSTTATATTMPGRLSPCRICLQDLKQRITELAEAL